ncbi:MAG: PD40 domain-containing protein [Holophagales bacterium]|nr:PD40 domain-containing protein [Holophagales bacterium]
MLSARRFAPLLLACLPFLAPPAAAAAARFVRTPDVRGDVVVLAWEGDLFRVPLSGGTAVRMTTHPGIEEAPRLSPDGKWVAFRASYDGPGEVYLMPTAGGIPRRLTFTGNASPVTWTPDGKRIVFRSGFESTFRPVPKLYSVSPEGELPDPLPPERGVLAAYSPDGTKLAYNRRGDEEYYWKRYKGGQYQDIWLYDFAAKSYTPLTDYVGKNSYPMWAGGGLLFVTDRASKGVANLWRLDPATKAASAVTAYEDFDVQMPSTDGKTVVFTRAGILYRMDVATTTFGKVEKVAVDVPSDQWALAERAVSAKETIQSMAVSSDGKWTAFEARGDIFLVSTDENGGTRNLTRAQKSRERFPRFSPDGTKVAFYSDRTGEYQLYVADATVEGAGKPWEAITTSLDRTAYHAEWSPDGTKLLFGDKDLRVFVVDVATKKLTKIAESNQLANDEFSWEISDYAWSPDGAWVAYAQIEPNRNGRIWLHELATGKTVPVTDGFYHSVNPSFDPKGELLYFLSYRSFTTRVDVFEDNHVIPKPVVPVAVQLRAGQRPPFEKGPKDEAKSAEPAPDGTKVGVKDVKDVKETKAAPKAALPKVVVDVEGLSSRLFPLPVKAGTFFHLKAGKGMVTWGATEDYGEDEIEQLFTPAFGKDLLGLHVFDVASQKEVTLEGNISDWRLSPSGEQVVVKKGAAFHASPLEKLFSGKVFGAALGLDRLVVRVDPRDEWLQVFDDAWRWYRDFFYDANMHGRDWKAMGAAYRAMVPELNSRTELNWLLSQMVGELCVSHTYVGGGDTGPKKAPEALAFTGRLGADLAAGPDGRFVIRSVFRPSGYTGDLVSPLARPDVNVKDGELLLAIDGTDLTAPDNPFRHLQVVKGQKVRLTVGPTADGRGSRVVEVEPLRSEYELRYDRWIAKNVAYVQNASGGKMGYVHLTAMGAENIAQFDRYYRAFHDRKGLVVDVRGNGGGWVEYFVIDKLQRKVTAFNVLKNKEPFSYPPGASSAHLAVLTNEYNGSDGEAFIEHWKAAKLGPVIGVPSWGGLVGIVNGQPTVDGGTVHQSNNSFYGRDGKWLVENHGADPDILLENDPASASRGVDLQLEKAVEVLNKAIVERPFTFPGKPAYPVR